MYSQHPFTSILTLPIADTRGAAEMALLLTVNASAMACAAYQSDVRHQKLPLNDECNVL